MLFVVATVFLHLQIPHEETPAKKLRLSKPSKSAALHIDLCKATNSTDALQYLLQFARKPVEAESVEGVVRILLEHYYKVKSCGYFFSPFFKNRVDKSRIPSVLKKKVKLLMMTILSSRRLITLWGWRLPLCSACSLKRRASAPTASLTMPLTRSAMRVRHIWTFIHLQNSEKLS